MKKSLFTHMKTVAVLIMICVLVSICGCGKTENKSEEIKTLGSGENDFYIEVFKNENESVKYKIFTDLVTVGDALSEHELIKYAQTDKDELYLSEVAGVKVDYENKKEYWGIFNHDEYMSSLPDSIAISCGDTYVFKISTLDLPYITIPDTKYEKPVKNDDEDESKVQSSSEVTTSSDSSSESSSNTSSDTN